jgi:tetratricopeptide (TPR) repeat protein
MVTGSPVTVARLVSEGNERSGDPTTGQLDVAVADLLAASPSVVLTPLPPEPPGRALYNTGMGLVGVGEYPEAIAAFDEAAAMGWEQAKLHAGRAYACQSWYYANGGCDLEQAIAHWTTAIELNPENSIYYAERGRAYHSVGQLDRCVAGFAKALELDPEEAYYWREKGACLLEMGDAQAAVADHNRAIELGGADAGFYVDRAWALLSLGEFDLAIADWTQTIDMEPDVPNHWFDRAAAYAQMGDNDAARSDYEEFMNLTEGEAGWEDVRAGVRQWLDSH